MPAVLVAVLLILQLILVLLLKSREERLMDFWEEVEDLGRSAKLRELRALGDRIEREIQSGVPGAAKEWIEVRGQVL